MPDKQLVIPGLLTPESKTVPELGEIRRGKELGFKDIRGLFIWRACIDCGKPRWVKLRNNAPESSRCRSCAYQKGGNRAHYKGGKRKSHHDYIQIKVQPDDFFYSMARADGYIYEHRLVMAKHLNRCLLPWEVVHHRNGIKNDNRIENLELLPTDKQHLGSTRIQKLLKVRDKRIEQLERRAIQLEAEITLLGGQLQGEEVDHA